MPRVKGKVVIIGMGYAVACGAFDLVLVCGAEKLKDTGLPIPGDYNPTQLCTSRVDTDFLPLTSWAQFALRYFHHYSITI